MIELGREKITQWGDPLSIQTKVECISIKEVEVFGKKISWCDGYATFHKIYQNSLYLIATGPENLDEVVQVAKDCLSLAAKAAAGTFIATPGELAVKAGAAYGTAQAVFSGCVAGRFIIQLDLKQEGAWPDDWQRI